MTTLVWNVRQLPPEPTSPARSLRRPMGPREVVVGRGGQRRELVEQLIGASVERGVGDSEERPEDDGEHQAVQQHLLRRDREVGVETEQRATP